MVSFMQRMSLAQLPRLMAAGLSSIWMPSVSEVPVFHISRPPFGTSSRTVAQDRRAAAKARAKKRAKRHGQD